MKSTIERFDVVLPVHLTARLRDETVPARSATCTAHDDHYACQDGHDAFVLRRSGETGIEVRDLNAAKPIEETDDTLASVLRTGLGRDDRVFRLEETATETCDALSPTR